MRTVTFADETLVDYINDHYIPVWLNHAEEVFEGQAPEGQEQVQYTKEQMAAYPEGGGGGNIRTFLVTADGIIRHAFNGYWSATTYRSELTAGLPWVTAKTLDEAREGRREHQGVLQAKANAIRNENPMEMKKPVKTSDIRRTIAAIELLVNNYKNYQSYVGRRIDEVHQEILEQNLNRGVIS
jgi:hypothetical protein